MSSSLNSLSAAAEDRKARLAQLRGIKRKQPTEQNAETEAQPEQSPPQQEEPDVIRKNLSGRNYDFETNGPKLGFEHMPNLGLDKPTLEEQAAEVEAEIRKQAAEEAQDDKGIDLLKLQPKKPNWDLKRTLDSKMEILNARTNNAITRMVRERISASQPAGQKGDASSNALADGEAVGVEGLSLVEGLRVREKEEREREQQEREEDETLLA